MKLPEEYTRRIQALPGMDLEEYRKALETAPPVSIRLNPEKIRTDLRHEKVSWCSNGYYLPERPVFTFDPVFQAGGYYVQEASSMFISHVLEQVTERGKDYKALDLCAAPGGKSTLLVSALSPGSLVVANEVIKSRVMVLRENLEKWGYPNTIVTNNDPKDFERLESYFDIMVVDAPCSGEGLFRKEPEAVKEWSEANVQLCSLRQERILDSAIQALKPGGILIYSTCTHEVSENEDQAERLCKQGFEEIKVSIPVNSGIEQSSYGYRFYPHKVKGEGFYCAVLKKITGNEPAAPKIKRPAYTASKKSKEAIDGLLRFSESFAAIEARDSIYFFPAGHLESLSVLAESLNIYSFGTEAGQLIKGELIPSQALAHSISLVPVAFEHIELGIDDAIRFLRKDPVTDPSGIKGWKLATFNGLGLGFLKNLGNRTNNYFPKERRILRQPASSEVWSLI
ncbi:MAG TPA: SAM-dependent methyltransferase [Bacteroidia bacterium]|nr:SAM-dependent methyltransferase [Bacteroidia bacterium]